MGAPEPGARTKSLDGLRGLAALAILVFHAGSAAGVTIWPLSWVALTGFFILSGYLVTTMMRSELARTGRIDAFGFLIRRTARLLPAMLVVVSAVAVLGRDPSAFATMSPFWNLVEAKGVVSPALTHLWTLALEWQFYLVAPLVIPILLRWPRGAAIGLPVALLVYVALRPQPHGLEGYYGTPWRVEGFVIGIALGLAGLGVRSSRGLEAIEPLGRISYGLYLWHYPLIFFIGPLFGLPLPVSIAAAFVAAAASWRYVEQPAIRWSRTVRKQPLIPVLVAVRTDGEAP